MQTQYERRGQSDLWWYNKAIDLRGGAAAIWDAKQKQEVFALNAGLSLELLLKAYWVFYTTKDFKEVSSKGHNLIKIAQETDIFGLLDIHQKALLEIFSEYIYWVGKYPVARDEQQHNSSLKKLQKQFKREPFGSAYISQPNEKTIPSWENYDALWEIISSHYWAAKAKKEGIY